MAVALSGSANFSRSAMWEDVTLLHQSLPELAKDEVSTSRTFLGKKLAAPIFISGMTGGYPGARKINRSLARVAEKLNIGFGVGSQRAMVVDPSLAATYQVRDIAPNALFLGNLGVVQLREMGSVAAVELAKSVGADGLAIHLNPAQELAQGPSGDRDFRGCLAAIEQLIVAGDFPVVVKETGAGISPQVAAQLAAVGVKYIDVAGAGGTSWTAVETLRAPDSRTEALGRQLWNWGVPTAVSVACSKEFATVIASGGITQPWQAVAALALGASYVGIAGEALRVLTQGGESALEGFLLTFFDAIAAACLLTGTRKVENLHKAPKVVAGELHHWGTSLGLW